MCVQFLWRTEGGAEFPKTRVKGFLNHWTWCRKPAQVLCKSSKCFEVLGHLSSPRFALFFFKV